MNVVELRKLLTYIEENLRASPSAGMEFVDARQFRDRLTSSQNHVVFGRRGAGKTTLVTATRDQNEHIDVYLNLEDYKDITFPNIVIRVVLELFEALLSELQLKYPWYKPSLKARRIKRELKVSIVELIQFLSDPDDEIQEINETASFAHGLNASVKTSSTTSGTTTSRNKSRSVSRKLPKVKLDHLRIKLSDYKKMLHSVSTLLSSQPIFLFLDDLYFVLKHVQPDLIDYFHRLTKGTELFLKVATIKHRSKLYRRDQSQYTGAELGHDIFEVDMDYTLDNFEELQSFMRQLLENAISKSNASIVVDDMFAGDGFSQLCLASGGVPRDFLSLFVTLAEDLRKENDAIGKVAVNEAAISKIGSKLESMKMDSGDDDGILGDYLSRLRRYVYRGKRTNAFLLAKEDLEIHPHIRQAVRELVDLRLIHLLDDNTSKLPSDGRRYEAYILDIGLYENSRPRNFTQIEPGQADEVGRRDKLRASPVFIIDDETIEADEESEVVLDESLIPRCGSDGSRQLELSFE